MFEHIDVKKIELNHNTHDNNERYSLKMTYGFMSMPIVEFDDYVTYEPKYKTSVRGATYASAMGNIAQGIIAWIHAAIHADVFNEENYDAMRHAFSPFIKKSVPFYKIEEFFRDANW